VVDDLRRHPLKTMLGLGLLVTVNSDDPAYFGGYVNENYRAVAAALDLTRADLATLARNSFTASFLDPAAKAARIAEVDAYVAGGVAAGPAAC
jgi:adenosine deaminase